MAKAVSFLLFFSLLILPRVSAADSIPENNSCLACHSDMWDEVKASAHSQNGIFCSSCHGGDASKADKDLAKGPDSGYLGIPDKKQIIQMCGECHTNVETMNSYGVRTDQLARYKTSHHGKKLLLEGDEDVAACVDCHGYHEIFKVSDPNSSVYPSNIPKTCGKCHANEKLMTEHGLPSDILKIYTSSVHGKALLEKKDLSVAQCAACHGSHGAVPPGVKDISAACGKCHMNEKKYFLESPHARLAEQGTFSECVACHSNHGVQHPTTALYHDACIQCHQPGTPAFEQGQKIALLLQGSETQLKEAEALVKQASIDGFFTEPEMAQLEQLKSNVLEMSPIQHTLSLDKLEELHGKVVKVSEEIQKSISSKQKSLGRRKKALIVIWAFIAIMVSALWAQYNRITKHKRK